MNKYEALYVIDAAMEDQARADLIALFQKLATDNGAEIEKVDEWGKRRLAYPINFKNEGYYVLMQFSARLLSSPASWSVTSRSTKTSCVTL